MFVLHCRGPSCIAAPSVNYLWFVQPHFVCRQTLWVSLLTGRQKLSVLYALLCRRQLRAHLPYWINWGSLSNYGSVASYRWVEAVCSLCPYLGRHLRGWGEGGVTSRLDQLKIPSVVSLWECRFLQEGRSCLFFAGGSWGVRVATSMLGVFITSITTRGPNLSRLRP